MTEPVPGLIEYVRDNGAHSTCELIAATLEAIGTEARRGSPEKTNAAINAGLLRQCMGRMIK